MGEFNRRAFLKTGGALALAGMAARPDVSLAAKSGDLSVENLHDEGPVRFIGDGLSLGPEEYSALLARLTAEEDFERDVYANGGIIEKLERNFAHRLGKEEAVFLPTGTLANHIALRRLVGPGMRVIVQAESHIYNDSGDCAQKLSGLNLVPIEGEFSAGSIERELNRAASGRVHTKVGCISLESPVRRAFNTNHSLAQVSEIAELARKKGLGLHLDGARLFMQAAHHGYSPAEFAAPFDTVYVSLYKNFNAAGGAVLAGPRETLADLFHERRMFGGSPAHAWPLAAVAGLFVDDFQERYFRAKAVTEQLTEHLKADSRFEFEKIPAGSNSFWMRVKGIDPSVFVANLAGRNIHLLEPRPNWNGLLMMINPTIGRRKAAQLANDFRAAAGA